MKVARVFNIAPKAVQIDFDNGEWAKLYEFGKTIVSEVSDGVKKSTLINIKKDCLSVEWDGEELEKLYK